MVRRLRQPSEQNVQSTPVSTPSSTECALSQLQPALFRPAAALRCATQTALDATTLACGAYVASRTVNEELAYVRSVIF